MEFKVLQHEDNYPWESSMEYTNKNWQEMQEEEHRLDVIIIN